MSYRHVEDSPEARPPAFDPFSFPRTLIRHSVWRCAHCRALAVTKIGTPPPKKCGKCHL